MNHLLQSSLGRRALSAVLCLSSLTLATGCWIPISSDDYLVENEGAAVVHAKGHENIEFSATTDELEVTLAPKQNLEVTVALDLCPPCMELESVTCTAKIKGDRIEVTARAEGTVPQMKWCPAVCMALTTTCELGALEKGSYTLSYGGNEVLVDIPADRSPIVGRGSLD